MTAMPTGTVTFLLTDVEGSTAAWERDPDATSEAIAALDRVVGEVVTAHGGIVVKPRGEGDSHFCVFNSATDAVSAGVALLRQLPDGGLPVRAAVHTGEADLRDGDYYGRTVNRAARLRSAGHGGQLLVSEVSAALIQDALPDGIELRDLGIHRLRDLSSPESIYEVVHPDLPEVRRALATLDVHRNNLPLQLTSLIGRAETVSEVLHLLSTRRLLSLVALGGTGKTRLALQVAAEASGHFRGGVWYAELAPLHDPEQVPGAILAAVGGPAGTDEPLAEAADWIAAREVLLVLDNCEHLIDAVATSVSHLLTRCAGLKILATSRQPLGVPGEAVFRLQPLGLPSADDVSLVGAAPAVQLFVERGRAVDPQFELTASNAPAIAKLCMGLDGLPLAIELAASRLKILDPEQILERLTDRLSLVDGARASTLNRTVRAAIEWSHELLDPDERLLLHRLAIFEGSVGYETVEGVCGEGLHDVAVALGGLVDHSLVTADTTATGRRYRLLDLVRAFATELMESTEERTALESARAIWLEARATFLRDAPASPADWADFLNNQPDVEAALHWRAKGGDDNCFADGVLIVSECWRFLERWTVAAAWVSRALIRDLDASRRLRLLLLGAHLAVDRWEFRDGIRLGTDALALARELGDATAEESAHNPIASCAWRSGQLDLARHHNEQALALARLRPDGAESAATAANNLGLVARSRDDLDEAERWFRESLELLRPSGRSSHGLWRLAQVAECRGDWDTATRLYESAIDTAQTEVSPSYGLAEDSFGRMLESRGQLDAARVNYQSTHDAAVKAGDASLSSRGLLNAARIAHRQGQTEAHESLTAKAFSELAGEPARQIVVVDDAIETARTHGLSDVAYDLSRRLLEVTLRDGTAKGAAWATYLSARAALEVDLPDEAKRLALQARAKLVALGDVDIGRESAATRIQECDDLLGLIDGDAASSLN